MVDMSSACNQSWKKVIRKMNAIAVADALAVAIVIAFAIAIAHRSYTLPCTCLLKTHNSASALALRTYICSRCAVAFALRHCQCIRQTSALCSRLLATTRAFFNAKI